MFGDGSWDTDSENGTVLEAHATSGSFIDGDATFGHYINLRDLVVKGRGDNSRTTVGVDIGQQQVQIKWINVTILNFATGLSITGANQCAFYGLISRGNDVGALLGANANANHFYEFDSSADQTGVKFTGGTTCGFYGGAIQGFRTYAIHGNGGFENSFQDIYLESGSAGAVGIKMDGAAGTDDYRFVNLHYGDTRSIVEVDSGEGHEFVLGKTHPPSMTFASGTANCRVLGRAITLGNITDNGDNMVTTFTGGAWETHFGDDGLNHPIVVNGGSIVSYQLKTDGAWGDFFLEVRDDIARWRMRNGPKAYDWIAGADDAGSPKLGFFDTTPQAQPSLTYSRGSETTAESQIRSALSTLGLAADNTTA